MRMRCTSPQSVSPSGSLIEPRGATTPRVSRCVGVSTMSGTEGLGTVKTPLPLALGGVWWCSTPRCGPET
eukprot:4596513-Pleurochrysis_carterae.AAC.1